MTMSSLYRDAEDGIIVENNKHINGLEINLERVTITLNDGFSVFNVCCGLPSMLILISISGRNKR